MKKLLPLFLAATAACAQTHPHWVLLPESAAAEVAKQCSRSAPRVEGGWTPTPQDIAALEQHLPDITRIELGPPAHRFRIEHPEQAFRQYVGVVVAGKRLVYVNAGSEPLTGILRQKVDIVCDGGFNFWGILFDPRTGTFADLQTNGPG